MASVGMAPLTAEKVDGDSMFVDKLPEEINEMKIRDDKVEKVVFYLLFFLTPFYMCIECIFCTMNSDTHK